MVLSRNFIGNMSRFLEKGYDSSQYDKISSYKLLTEWILSYNIII